MSWRLGEGGRLCGRNAEGMYGREVGGLVSGWKAEGCMGGRLVGHVGGG